MERSSCNRRFLEAGFGVRPAMDGQLHLRVKGYVDTHGADNGPDARSQTAGPQMSGAATAVVNSPHIGSYLIHCSLEHAVLSGT